MKKLWISFACILLISGCESLPKPYAKEGIDSYKAVNLCDTEELKNDFKEFCNPGAWVKYYLEMSEVDWSVREEHLALLSDSSYDVMKKILLSQGEDTPYNDRLRAQTMLTTLQTQVGKSFADALEILIFAPSQQRLEMKSEISILTKLNSQQERELDEVKEALELKKMELAKQRQQLEELLKIEATMVDQKNTESE